MIEREIDNRGSKSNINNFIFVKEQRADGNYIESRRSKYSMLRYALMDFEKNYQIKIRTKQFYRSFSISSKNQGLNP